MSEEKPYRVKIRHVSNEPWRTTNVNGREETDEEFAKRIGVGEKRTGGTIAPKSGVGTTKSEIDRHGNKVTQTWGGKQDVEIRQAKGIKIGRVDK